MRREAHCAGVGVGRCGRASAHSHSSGRARTRAHVHSCLVDLSADTHACMRMWRVDVHVHAQGA
jgi:hypothetical protein